jgi:multiple antibiotic resistance protein
MIQTAAIAFATFFATIGPIDVAAMFTAITSNSKPAHRRAMAIKGTLVATGILDLVGGTTHRGRYSIIVNRY